MPEAHEMLDTSSPVVFNAAQYTPGGRTAWMPCHLTRPQHIESVDITRAGRRMPSLCPAPGARHGAIRPVWCSGLRHPWLVPEETKAPQEPEWELEPRSMQLLAHALSIRP